MTYINLPFNNNATQSGESTSQPATNDRAGGVKLATAQQAIEGVNVSAAITPATMRAALDDGYATSDDLNDAVVTLNNTIAESQSDYATTQDAGLIVIATAQEALNGENDENAITPATLKIAIEDSQPDQATTDQAGIIRIATEQEALDATDTESAVTPAGLGAAISAIEITEQQPLTVATTSAKGIVELATNDEAVAGESAETVITPANLQAKLDSISGEETADDEIDQGVTYPVELADGELASGELATASVENIYLSDVKLGD